MSKLPPLPPLPSRQIMDDVWERPFNFKEILGKNNEFISSHVSSLYVDSETLKNNFDFFLHTLKLLLNERRFEFEIFCENYECIKLINSELKERENLTLHLQDDLQLIDRSYIEPDSFDKFNLTIPLTYIMWNVDFQDKAKISLFRINNCLANNNGNTEITKESLMRLREIISSLNKYQPENDLQKIILVSNYLQEHVQFIESEESKAADGIYIVTTPFSKEELHRRSSLIEAVINDNYGLCMSIANTSTLLLNNPVFQVNVRSIFGPGHAWNEVELDGIKQYMDNTWCITRNNNRVPGALKAQSFSSDYLLFGEDKAQTIGYHTPTVTAFNNIISSRESISKEDFSRGQIEEAKHVLSRKIPFTYSGKLTFPSYKK